MGMFASGLRGGINFPQLEAAPLDLPPAPVARKSGFFDRDGMGVNLLGGLADAGLALTGQQQVFGPAMDARRARQQQLEDDERRARLTADQWRMQQQWKTDHPEPINNDTVNDYNFIAGRLGTEAADRYLGNLSDPYVNTTLPGDRFYSGPRSGLPAALGSGGGAPAAPVGKLTPIGGGAAPQAPAPFLPYSPRRGR